jgi:hypothetical protein
VLTLLCCSGCFTSLYLFCNYCGYRVMIENSLIYELYLTVRCVTFVQWSILIRASFILSAVCPVYVVANRCFAASVLRVFRVIFVGFLSYNSVDQVENLLIFTEDGLHQHI